MTINDQDTDPSTPGARHPPRSRAASTDPGVGPPPQVTETKAMSVVVPPPSRTAPEGQPVSVFASTARKKDSVELLLEGMAGPRPDRVKTTPRTAGEASASYHAEHAVHAAYTCPDDDPKVMVEGGSVQARERTDPSGFRASLAEVPEGWRAADPTHVPARPLGPRIVLAALAGLLVVLVIFVALGRTPELAPAVAPTLTLPPLPTPVTLTATPLEPVVALTANPAVDPVPEPPSVTSPVAPPAPPAQAPQARASKGRPRASAPAADLGEFKTTF